MAQSNLTREEMRGLRSLKDKENVVIYQTDKSGRFAVDTMDNYHVACQPHVENDLTVTENLHERLQTEANAHSGSVGETPECKRNRWRTSED